MRHRGEALSLLYRLGWLTPRQLARLLVPAPKVLPGRPADGPLPRVVEEPTPWSATTGWRALEDLRGRGYALRERAHDPLRPSTANGGSGYAYALTSPKGVRAGAFAAGEDASTPERLKRARAKYMRSMIDASRVGHALLRNEWLAMVSAEAHERGVAVGDAWAEGGSVLRTGAAKVAEPDGRIALAKGDGGRLTVLLESDTGTQREAAVRAKTRAYGGHLIDVTDFGRDGRSLGRLPLVLFVSKSGRRSERVLDFIAAELREQRYGPTRESLGRLRVDYDNLFLVTNLEWALADGALGESCVAVGTEEFWSLLDFPHLIRETY